MWLEQMSLLTLNFVMCTRAKPLEVVEALLTSPIQAHSPSPLKTLCTIALMRLLMEEFSG